jgi:hypothetical protein
MMSETSGRVQGASSTVGAFPDGQSALMLVAARLRHVAVRRFAQDDDFVGVLKKNIPNMLAVMGIVPDNSTVQITMKSCTMTDEILLWAAFTAF